MTNKERFIELLNFNPRSLEGSDYQIIVPLPEPTKISIHAPARGATVNVATILNFLPEISIHAPARGATQSKDRHPGRNDISIHAPARGATLPELEAITDTVISIHAPARGATFSPFFSLRLATQISIHAPARGATSILSKIHPMFLTISHNASSFSSFPFHSFLPHLLNSSTFCALFQVRISRAFSVYYRFAPKKSTPDL